MKIAKFFIFSLFFAFSIALQATVLNKAFFHIGNSQDKLIFYFNNDPKVSLLSSNKITGSGKVTLSFLLSGITITKEGNLMINKINNTKNNFYNLEILKKTSNLEIKITYDPKKVLDISIYSFPAITSSKGITFNISHKPISSKISKKRNIIIDMGHGGKDTGAVGVSGTQEKDITYKIGMKLYGLLKDRFNVYFTRNKDQFVALDKRTSFANKLSGNSIFISIHANHANNSEICGLESYYADYNLLKSLDFNLGFAYKVDDSKKNLQSKLLCENLHNKLVQDLKKINKNFVDRKAKKSISQVLIGTEMPSVLIEVGFLSNMYEEELLNTDKYINSIVKSLQEGIVSYFSSFS